MKSIEMDKLIHSSVGLGIKLGQSYNLISSIIVAVVTYYTTITSGIITSIVLTILSISKGAYFIGYLKELYDKYVRKTTFDIEDIRATQNSNIVINWYNDIIKK